jgi:hypothetical protein
VRSKLILTGWSKSKNSGRYVSSISFTPAKINIALKINAHIIPRKSTLCCNFFGTLKKPKTIMNTNKLSTDKSFSTQYADWKYENLSNPSSQ